MNQREIGQVLASQLLGMTRDRTLSYVSSISPDYSKLTDDGKRVMSELVDMMFIKMVAAEKQREQDCAEQLIMDNLKK